MPPETRQNMIIISCLYHFYILFLSPLYPFYILLLVYVPNMDGSNHREYGLQGEASPPGGEVAALTPLLGAMPERDGGWRDKLPITGSVLRDSENSAFGAVHGYGLSAPFCRIFAAYSGALRPVLVLQLYFRSKQTSLFPSTIPPSLLPYSLSQKISLLGDAVPDDIAWQVGPGGILSAPPQNTTASIFVVYLTALPPNCFFKDV